MNDDVERSVTRGGQGREGPGSLSSDRLLRDLDGMNGDAARAVATGYLMAIQDADADCLSSAALLQYLRCESDSVLELTGAGYVMAVREWMETPRDAARAAAPEVRARMRSDAAQVKAWLEREPGGVMQPAIASVQLALAGPPAAVPEPASVRRGQSRMRAWLVAQSVLAKSMSALAAALAVVVVLQHVPVVDRDRADSAARDLEVSVQAENIMAMLLEQRRYEKDSIINMSDPPQSDAYARKWNTAHDSMVSTLDALGMLDLTADDAQSLGEIKRDLHQYEQGYLQLLNQMRSGRVHTPQDANRLLEACKPAAHRIETNGLEIAARALRRLERS